MIATIHAIVSGIPTPAGSVWMPTNGSVNRSTQIPNPVGHACRRELAAELREPRQAAEVVDDADGDRDRPRRAGSAVLASRVEEGERRHEQPEEERQPAEPRHGQRVDAPPAGQVDDPEPPRHPSHRRREEDDDDERDDGSPDDVEIVGELVEDAEMRAAEPEITRSAYFAAETPQPAAFRYSPFIATLGDYPADAGIRASGR